GFGRLSTRGSQNEYVELLKGMPLEKMNPNDNPDVFAGIDVTWNRVAGGKAIARILEAIESDFNFKNPSTHLPDLMKALRMIEALEDEHWSDVKTKEIKKIIEACAGLYLEVSADGPTASPGSAVALAIEALNRQADNIVLKSYKVTTEPNSKVMELALETNRRENLRDTITIPSNLKNTAPYWLNSKGTLGMYKVNDQQLIGQPETPRSMKVLFKLEVAGQPLEISKDVVYRYSKPDEGELYRPFEILPEVTAHLGKEVYIFDSDKQQDVEVIVRAGRSNLEGTVSMAYPQGWSVHPGMQKVSIAQQGDTETLIFTVIPPKDQSEGLLTPMVEVNNTFYTRELVEIDYDHIPFQTVILPSESKIVRIDIIKKGQTIGYIEGAGDAVPESLNNIGYSVIKIKPQDINADLLSQFDAVVVGIRAYNILDELKFKQDLLFDFVEQGGNMIVQYNTSRRLKVDQIAPYPLKLSRDRVTDENAEVRFIDPDHPLLNYPNKIEPSDFNGWVQERGLYFPGEWSEEFTPILSLNDPGESPKEGSLLVAKHGKGHYIYTGLSFFREFPEGVPGAYRLFANMLSIGKDNINLDKKLTD
ncbi:MAG: LmbE family protein, partial [Flavobacteriaceae bacterium]|nr:LmbE family protein [Flavobacteriaceae bacterium]